MKWVYRIIINLIGTMLRSILAKGKPKKLFYRCYKNFDDEKFELKKHLSSVLDFESFHFAFKTTLHQFTPLKQRVVQNNNEPFMTKSLHKATVKRSKLRNKFSKEKKSKNWSDYKQQRNYCSNLLKESKTGHFNNFNVND